MFTTYVVVFKAPSSGGGELILWPLYFWGKRVCSGMDVVPKNQDSSCAASSLICPGGFHYLLYTGSLNIIRCIRVFPDHKLLYEEKWLV
jgi:hypothetical protein